MWRSGLSWAFGMALAVSSSAVVAMSMDEREGVASPVSLADFLADDATTRADQPPVQTSSAEDLEYVQAIKEPEGNVAPVSADRTANATLVTMDQLLQHATVQSPAQVSADGDNAPQTEESPSQGIQQRPTLVFSLVEFLAAYEGQPARNPSRPQTEPTHGGMADDEPQPAYEESASLKSEADNGVSKAPSHVHVPESIAERDGLSEKSDVQDPVNGELLHGVQPQSLGSAKQDAFPADPRPSSSVDTMMDQERHESDPGFTGQSRDGSALHEPDWVESDTTAVFSPIIVEGALLSYNEGYDNLHLFDAVRRAVINHPSIAESLGRLDQQGEQVTVARAGYWPQVSTGINTGYRHSTGRTEEAFSLSASQMLYDFGKVSNAVDAATRGVEREQAGVALTAESLIRETAHAFIEALRYEKLLEIATEQIDAIADLEALAAKRSALGASTASDQVQARARREAARATQLQMQAQRDQWHRTLEHLIGSAMPITLADDYPASLESACPSTVEDFSAAPQVIMAEARRAEAQAVIRQARANMLPTLSLSADFEHYLNRDRDDLQRLDDQEFFVRLNLTSNIFQGGALSARRRAAEYALRSATAGRDAAVLELSTLYKESRDRSVSLASSLALQDERLEGIIRTQELYRHQYLSLGTRTLLDILNTEQEIFQTRFDKQNTLSDLRRLQIDCLYSIGELQGNFRVGSLFSQRVEAMR